MSFLDTSSMTQMVAALGAVLLLIWGASRLAGRHRATLRPGGRLGVRSVCAVDPRRRLVLVACDGREGLLLTGPAGDQFLGWLPGA
jgi:flagellar protein FliO/FliZ